MLSKVFFASQKNSIILFFLAMIAAIAMAACGGGDGGVNSGGNSGDAGGNAPSSVVTVSGVVQDVTSIPLANAVVQLGEQRIVTGVDGRFSFVISSSVDSVVLLVKKPGFATNAKDVPVGPSSTTQITIRLAEDQVSTTFLSTAGINFSANGASIEIPANAIQDLAGVTYTGAVSVGANYHGPDTVAGVQAFPAPYVGVDVGSESPLITMGVIEVKLTDAAGKPLQLKSGSPATLTYPANNVSAGAGAGAGTVPLWYYDEANTIWTREGEATKQGNGTYRASVTHFTLWNADFKGEIATIKGCFKDPSGAVVTHAGIVGLRGNGWQRQWLGVTSDGNFEVVRLPANMPLELYSARVSPEFVAIAIPSLSPGEVRVLPCVVVANPPLGSINVVTSPDTIFTTTTASFAGNYSGTYSGSESGTFQVNVNSSGQVFGNATSTTYPGLISPVTGVVSSSGAALLTAAGQAGMASFSGSISGTSLTGTWTYTSGLVGSGTFVGQRN